MPPRTQLHTSSKQLQTPLVRNLFSYPNTHLFNWPSGRAAAPANLNDPTSIRSWSSNLRNALKTISVLEPEEDDDAVEQAGDQLFMFFDKMTLSQPALEFQPPQPNNKGPDVVGNNGDNEEDKIVGGPDVCETDEMDIFAIPIQDMRRSFLEYLVDPVLLARAYAKLKACSQLRQASDEDVEAGAKAGYRCPRCTLYTHRDPVPENIFESISKLERHLLTNHSDWDDLELQIVTSSANNIEYHCPAGDYKHGESVQDVRRHALSGTCINSNLYNAMAQLREELVPKHKISRSFQNTRQGRSNVVNGINRLEVEDEPEETPMLDLKDEVKGLVNAAVEFYDYPEVMTVAQVLLDYVEDKAESLRPLGKQNGGPSAHAIKAVQNSADSHQTPTTVCKATGGDPFGPGAGSGDTRAAMILEPVDSVSRNRSGDGLGSLRNKS
ncbi:hypothetical protein GGX14DRAFT_389803 [Mycena pura]|uniref:Uncharacterized protein n=1 Tax=Mycena pura TaxID=153505 RepID=A0AAD6YI95_9AGAR|nr:hypothetical protein GGX14DRAFT_389803 [Mycena pura]